MTPRDLPTPELERLLGDVGRHLEDPPPLDLAAVVSARLRDDVRTTVPRGFRTPKTWLPRLEWRSVAVAAAAAVVIVAAVLVFSPGARRAVAGWLGLRGVRIEVTPTPVPTTPSVRPVLDLGPEVTLREAQREVGFRLLLPNVPELGRPDEVHVDPLYLSEQAFLVYRARPGIPAAGETGLALLVSEFRAAPDEGFYKKVSVGGESVEFVMVNGEPGFWIEGAHVVGYIDENGVPIQDSTRVAGNVLLWQHGELTLRIESALSKNEVLRIARSFR
ncbi:MAG: hypothetical protein ABR518_10235 [Actinomycetota bacterium]